MVNARGLSGSSSSRPGPTILAPREMRGGASLQLLLLVKWRDQALTLLGLVLSLCGTLPSRATKRLSERRESAFRASFCRFKWSFRTDRHTHSCWRILFAVFMIDNVFTKLSQPALT